MQLHGQPKLIEIEGACLQSLLLLCVGTWRHRGLDAALLAAQVRAQNVGILELRVNEVGCHQ